MWAGNFLNNMTSILKKKLVRHAYKFSTMGCQMHWGSTRNALKNTANECGCTIYPHCYMMKWTTHKKEISRQYDTGYWVRGPITWQAILLLPTYWDLVIVNFRRDCRRCALDVHTRSLRSKRRSIRAEGRVLNLDAKGLICDLWFVFTPPSTIRDLCSASSLDNAHMIIEKKGYCSMESFGEDESLLYTRSLLTKKERPNFTR